MKIKQESKQEKTKVVRRRLLAGGVASGIAAPLIPATWTKPLVQSVLSPVHAQTTCRDSIVIINGCEICCGDTEDDEDLRSHRVFLDGNCLRSETEQQTPGEVTPGELRIVIECALEDNPVRATTNFSVLTDQGEIGDFSTFFAQFCSNLSAPTQSIIDRQVVSSDDNTFRVTATIERTAACVSVSDVRVELDEL